MQVFIVGITGGTGGRLAEQLVQRGDKVAGLARRREQVDLLARGGIHATLGDLVTMSEQDLAKTMEGSDVIVFTAGASGEDDRLTTQIDGRGPGKVASAAALVGIRRFYLVSVFPEAWRGHDAPAEFEHYIDEKKNADVDISKRDIDWVIVRPGSLNDDPGVGTIDLGFAKIHGQITREDVASTIADLIHEPAIRRVILELTGGTTPIADAVRWVRTQMAGQ